MVPKSGSNVLAGASTMETATTGSALIPLRVLARRVGLTEGAIKLSVRAGDLPAYQARRGGKLLFDYDEVLSVMRRPSRTAPQ
jgi:hypothetical protein